MSLHRKVKYFNAMKRTLMKKYPMRNATLSEFDIKKLICQGSYGKVYLSYEKRTSKPFAVKECLKEHVEAQILKESDILKELEHPNIVKLHATFSELNKCYLVMVSL